MHKLETYKMLIESREKKKSRKPQLLLNEQKGFTLVEMLLVLVITATLIYAALGYFQQRTLQMRMDRTSIQMQQILNAGLAFYVANSNWPTDITTDLQGTYLPNITPTNPWGQTYTISISTPTSPTGGPLPSSFYVTTSVIQATTTGTPTGSA